MAKIASAELRRLAVVGARARLQELQGEIAALVSAFPEIGRTGRQACRDQHQASETRPQDADDGCRAEGSV